MAVEGPERRILAFGDSLFAGYGLEENEGYPEQLEDALRKDGINARVIDAGVSGDTSAAGLQRLAFT
ncbi:MAG TPA: arylesterase, partial [Erythrobacter sp.]|nr:arylesterase [Erythrobacter sp.]